MRPVAPQLVGCILILCTGLFCLPKVHSSDVKLVPERWREHLRFLGSDARLRDRFVLLSAHYDGLGSSLAVPGGLW
ncbi:MAG: hypothetical protein WAO20_10440 [Acidobacteriota bacterium]